MMSLVGAIFAVNAVARAQVVIDMPPPKSSPPPQTVAPAIQPDLGEVALTRYARVRTGPYDTYDSSVRYAGIRYYGDPFFGFCGFPQFGFFGNRFVGFVGCRPITHCP